MGSPQPTSQQRGLTLGSPPIAVHRIGRTGRSGNTGIATTFINKACGESTHTHTLSGLPTTGARFGPDGFPQIFPADESVLMDLKALLLEARQKVPPVLQVLHCGDESMLDIGGQDTWALWAGRHGGVPGVARLLTLCPHSRRAWLCLLWGPRPPDY